MAADSQAQPEQHICLDCTWHAKEPEMSTVHLGYCVHMTPEYWAEQGWTRNWGDAAVMAWPTLEILRRPGPAQVIGENSNAQVEFLVLNGDMRRPVRLTLSAYLSGWGAF